VTLSQPPEPKAYRSLFISDLHLGTKGCQSELFLDFLKHHDAETIYLVGDIIDFWRLKRTWYWPQQHNDVIQKLLRKGRKGAKIIYVPGNHDEFLREYIGTHFGGIEVVRRAIHTTANDERLLIIHGDEFDVVVRYARWLAMLGDVGYNFALFCNTHFNVVRRKLGFPYWSLSAWLKLKVKNAVNFIGEFEEALASEAARLDVHGVVCGHIHHPADRMMKGVRYLNCGDWVESCTALAEREDGTLELIHWPVVRAPDVVSDLEAARAAA
jgi:UDP-2,3-diacylglucosamine pyrophosphatase LpxH